MRRVAGYCLLGLLAYVVFMFFSFPATILLDRVAQRIPGFSVQTVEGSALYGSAQGVRLGAAQFESLSWRLRFAPFLLARLGYQLSLNGPEIDLDGKIAMNIGRQLYVDDLRGEMVLTALAALFDRPHLPLAGRLQLDGLEAELDPTGRPRSASGTIRLLDTRSTLGTPQNLGNFRLNLNSKDEDIVGNIGDEGGPLELTGNLTLAPNGDYRFNGVVALRDENNRELRQTLNLMGRPGGDGKWRISFNGRL